MPPHLRRMAEAITASEPLSESDFKELLFRSSVFEFVRHEQIEVIKILIRQGTDMGIRDQDGHTLLHIAAWTGALETTKLLIESGCDIDALDKSGRSPLFGAALSNQYVIAELLLQKGADVNGNSKHNSPLCGAAWYGYPEIVKLLLVHKPDLYQTDSDGNTALHKSVWQSHIEIVELLLAAGANKHASNRVGQTPECMAADRWNEKRSSSTSKRPWGPEQAIGPPDASAGDNSSAWASKTADGQKEWLIVHFADAVVPDQIEVYENLGFHAIQRVTIFDHSGTEQTVWKGLDPAMPNEKGVHVANIKFDTKLKINKVKIYIVSPRISSWNEVDAVGLIDKNGNKQWANWVEASSTYATGEPAFLNHQRILELIKSD